MNIFQKLQLKSMNNKFKKQLQFIHEILLYKLSQDHINEKILVNETIDYIIGETIKDNKINDEAKRLAENVLNSDFDVRKLSVYTYRMSMILKAGLLGKSYLESSDYKQKCFFLEKYGSEFHEEVNPKMYDEIFLDFAKKQ